MQDTAGIRPVSYTHLFSMTCTLEDYTVEDDAGEGVDLKVSLNFKQWVHYGTKTVTFQKSGGKTTTSTKKSRKSASKKGSGGTYTVKKGDCLINIAKKKLGSGNRWKEIYKPVSYTHLIRWARPRIN